MQCVTSPTPAARTQKGFWEQNNLLGRRVSQLAAPSSFTFLYIALVGASAGSHLEL
jgi:hypothetical protein